MFDLTYTPGGQYVDTMQAHTKAAVRKRLSRIEGQVRSVAGMIEGDRHCIDVVAQIFAVRAALRKVGEEVLRDHVAQCIAEAFASRDAAAQRDKVEELVRTFGRMVP